jgi:hypothetical protein
VANEVEANEVEANEVEVNRKIEKVRKIVSNAVVGRLVLIVKLLYMCLVNV